MDTTALQATSASEDDPFEAFNRAMGSGRVTDPYPDLTNLRRQAPVVTDDIRRLMGLPPEAVVPEDLPPLYTALSFDAVQEVLKDGERFSSSAYAMGMEPVMGRTILQMDEPDHHAYRGLIQQAFTRKEMDRWADTVVVNVVDELIDRFVGDGHADLVRGLTFPFPVTVIAYILGLPREDLPVFHRLGIELISVSVDPDVGMRASATLREYFLEILADRRRKPADDVISILAGAELDGQRLTDEEIVSFLRLLLPAGAETTYRSSSNLLWGLLSHPEQLKAVRDDRSLLPQAIEEGLRWEPPLLMIMRLATRDTEISGVPVPAGALISVGVGAANHDETRWDRPAEFDIFRTPKPHIAFASGAHMCLGMHLARMETTVVMNRILDRLPGLRLDPDGDAQGITGLTFRAPTSLPVVWET
jgi:cytochrome P450